MPKMVWKPWAPPKCNFCFAWLFIQKSIWTADILKRRGWHNYGRCKLCDQVQESAALLLFQSRFSTRVWTTVKSWFGMHAISLSDWSVIPSIKDWWVEVIYGRSHHARALASMAMLISWEFWKEGNALAFRNPPSTMAN